MCCCFFYMMHMLSFSFILLSECTRTLHLHAKFIKKNGWGATPLQGFNSERCHLLTSCEFAGMRVMLLLLNSINQTDQMLVHLQSFNSIPEHYTIPESTKNGVPLFYIPPGSTTPVSVGAKIQSPKVWGQHDFFSPRMHEIDQKWQQRHL